VLRLAAVRAINPTVVIEIVLAVMLLGVDAFALDVLSMIQTGALLASHHAVGLGAVFHVVYMLLASFEPVGFARRQAARSDTLIDTSLLIGFALIDPRRIGLGESKYGKNKGKHGEGLGDFHVFSPDG
jgi:hypothetical protein